MAKTRRFPKTMRTAAERVLRELRGANLIPQGSGAGVYASVSALDGTPQRFIRVYVGRNMPVDGSDPWAVVLDSIPWDCRIERNDHSNGTVFRMTPPNPEV
jgi:hypothetical protein